MRLGRYLPFIYPAVLLGVVILGKGGRSCDIQTVTSIQYTDILKVDFFARSELNF